MPGKTRPRVAEALMDKGKELCPICCVAIIDGKEESIFCEGNCHAWLHRRCAGVSTSYFKSLSSNSAKFLCSYCSCQVQQESISPLVSEVASLKAENAELRETIEAFRSVDKDTISVLVNSISKLKKDVSRAVLNQDKIAAQPNEMPWSQVVRKKPKLKKSKPRSDAGQKVLSSEEKIEVKNARRVWGTLRTTTSAAVRTTLQQLIGFPESDVIVKRKFKTANGDSDRVIKWWSVVRGNGETIQQLESGWPKVQLQTAWKLEPLYFISKKKMPNKELSMSTDQLPSLKPQSTEVCHTTKQPSHQADTEDQHTHSSALNTLSRQHNGSCSNHSSAIKQTTPTDDHNLVQVNNARVDASNSANLTDKQDDTVAFLSHLSNTRLPT